MAYSIYTLSRSETGQGQSRQRYDYIEVLRVCSNGDCNTLRILIHFDSSYHHQSMAQIERWDGNRWHEVHRLIGDAMKSRVVAYPELQTAKPRIETVYTPDRDELLAVALKILGMA